MNVHHLPAIMTVSAQKESVTTCASALTVRLTLEILENV